MAAFNAQEMEMAIQANNSMLSIGGEATELPKIFMDASYVQYRHRMSTISGNRLPLTNAQKAFTRNLFGMTAAQLNSAERLFLQLYPVFDSTRANYNPNGAAPRRRQDHIVYLAAHAHNNIRVHNNLAAAGQARVRAEMDFFEQYIAVGHNATVGTHRRIRRSEAGRLFTMGVHQRRHAPRGRPLNGRHTTRHQMER